ncbi:MAG: hypothetical protein KAW92_02540 [Candidatus Cloacimonetes bacterium]|nr:hypothetical protein [Candidatus Cloacimonadota bacterium]
MKKTISIIDMGTNSVLLLIAESQNDSWNILHRDAKTSSLGKGMKNGLLAEEEIKKTKKILTGYINISKKYNCNKIIITGTSASREAKNITKISDWLKINYGLHFYILSENDELKYIYSANIKEFPEFYNMLIFDIGGGSTEFILIKNKEITMQKSLKIGVRRLNNLFKDNKDKIDYIKKTLKQSKLIEKTICGFESIGVGGTVTNLVAVKKKMHKYIPEKVHKQILYKSDVEYFKKLWFTLSNAEAKKLIPFDPLRADVLLSGSLILLEIFNYFSIEKIYVSDCGIQFGTLYNM